MEDDKDSTTSCESDDEKEEPKLKYEGILGDVKEILMQENASCIYVNDKLLILGTNRGRIHVFDHQGNRVKQFLVHSGPVFMIDMDLSGDYLASCSNDRKIIVQGLYNHEMCYNITSCTAVKCIGMDPMFGRSTKRRIIVGTHQLVLHEKGLFGSMKSTVLYDGAVGIGELIRSVRWKGRFMAWAMDSAIRVMDMDAKDIISLIKRDHSLALGCDQYPPHLCWEDERTLIVGWGDSVKVCRIRERTPDTSGKYASLDLPPFYVEIVYMFSTDFYICGIGPLDKLLVVLAYNKTLSAETKMVESSSSLQEWRRPQLRVLLPLQGAFEELSKDILAIRGYEKYQSVDYNLVYLNEDRRFYILCPQNVVVAKPREAQDRVKWLIEHQKFNEALQVLEKYGGRVMQFTTVTVGQTFVDFLLQNNQFEEAAKTVSRILGQNKVLWETAVKQFNDIGQLKHLSTHIPTGPPGPLLSNAIYRTVLSDLLKHDHEVFLRIIQTWPRNLYNVSILIDSVLEVLTKNSSNTVLLRALAHLYSNADKHDKALAIYLKLKHKDLFGLIQRHSLYWCVSKHILDLMSLDVGSALQMCSQYIDVIDPAKVVTALSSHQEFLYEYLDMLYTNQRDYSQPYHNELIRLYAIYDRAKIMPLLLSSSHIDLEPAFKVVRSYCLVPETVHLLIRMGSSESALRMVLEDEGDIHWAVNICKQHSDPDLWTLLIDFSLDKPAYIRVVLESMGAHVDPLLILRRIPSSMEIPGLRDALTKIMHDYQLKISLQNDYQKILINDGIRLLEKQVSSQKAAIAIRSDSECSICDKKLTRYNPNSDYEIVVFGCRHSYHSKCLAIEQPEFEVCILCHKSKKLSSVS